MGGNVIHNPLRFRVAEEAALHTDGALGSCGEIEHIAPAQQLFRAVLVQNGSAVNAGRYGKGNAGRNVGLNQAGNHVHRGTLGSHNQVDAGRAGQLSDTNDAFLHLFFAGQHQVRQFIDDNHDSGQLGFARFQLGVIGGNIAYLFAFNFMIAVQHFRHSPGQRARRLMGVADHGNQQMRHHVIALQLHHLGVDHDHAHFLR